MKRFTSSLNEDGKQIFITGGPKTFGLGIIIDYDDVDHEEVDKQVLALVRLLDKHWPRV